jgi:hypothetical protein
MYRDYIIIIGLPILSVVSGMLGPGVAFAAALFLGRAAGNKRIDTDY